MTQVRLDVLPDAAYVRVARLVAVSMARLSGVDEGVVEDVRLAVGEACGRAVAAHLQHGLVEPVSLSFEGGRGLAASVVDRVGLPAARGHDAVALLLAASADRPGADVDLVAGDAPAVLALLEGLAQQVEVRTGADGTTVDLRWGTAG